MGSALPRPDGLLKTYAAGKDIAWEMLKAYSRPFIAELPNESELRVDFWNGARIKIYGSDNPTPCAAAGSTWSS